MRGGSASVVGAEREGAADAETNKNWKNGRGDTIGAEKRGAAGAEGGKKGEKGCKCDGCGEKGS